LKNSKRSRKWLMMIDLSFKVRVYRFRTIRK
jgi:hypothetical protein